MCGPIEIIKLFSYIILGVLVVAIAYNQWIVAKNKLDLDLYNKRFEVYKDALTFYQDLIGDEPSRDIHRKFIISKEAAFHLFSDSRDIYDLLNEMHENSAKVTGFKNLGNELDGSPEQKMTMYNDSMQVLSWFDKSMPILRDKMSRYLKQ